MSHDAFAIYLNDHLAGSHLAIDLLEHLIETGDDPRERGELDQLLGEIREDQALVRRLQQDLAVSESPLKRAGAWLAERLAELRLRMGKDAALQRLESLEMLGLGIQGKAALWRALNEVADRHAPLRSLDLLRLEQRAIDQFQRADALRLAAARAALA